MGGEDLRNGEKERERGHVGKSRVALGEREGVCRVSEED